MTHTAMGGPGLVVDEWAPNLMEHSTAVFSDDRVYRYALTRSWDPALPAAVFIMLNPSTASATAEDPTSRRVRGFAESLGCGGLIIVNLFAYRATLPEALQHCADPVGMNNDGIIQAAVLGPSNGPVIAAWGTHGVLHGRDQAVAALTAALGVDLHCLGLTQGGHPRHPLYLPADSPLTPFPRS